jgi:hypothetical protein
VQNSVQNSVQSENFRVLNMNMNMNLLGTIHSREMNDNEPNEP